MIGIYKITNLMDGKVYIGQSIDIARRFNAHKTKPFLKGDRSYNTLFYRAIRKYGLENFKFEVLQECPISDLNKLEKKYIAKYDSFRKSGYNSTKGGQDGAANMIYSEKTVDSIIKELKNNDLTITEIAELYGMAISSISMINSGKMRRRDGEVYPIRNTKVADAQIKQNFVRCKCGGLKWKTSKFCKSCFSKMQIIKRPNKEKLLMLVATLGFSEVGRQYAVSGNTIKKWCIAYNLPEKIADIQKLYGNYKPPKQPLTNRKTDSHNRRIVVVKDEVKTDYNSVNDFADWLIKKKIANTDHRRVVQSIRRVLRKERNGYLGYSIFWND